MIVDFFKRQSDKLVLMAIFFGLFYIGLYFHAITISNAMPGNYDISHELEEIDLKRSLEV
jgi:hypothetical protein